MIEVLGGYSNRRESGLEWLGRIPEHWEIKRGKTLFRAIDVRSETGEEELLTVSSRSGVVPRRSADVTMFKAESYVGHKLCWPGDLVINSLWAWAGGLGVSRHHGIVSTAYGVYRPNSTTNDRYIHALVRSIPFQWELQVRSKGIWTSRLQLTDTAFLDAPIPTPPPDEQAAIVRFLDHLEQRVQRYVRAKRKLVALLEEQKQTIIHRAVTRGLDSDVPFKPSGVEWLGDVPAHWEVWRLKDALTRPLRNGLFKKKAAFGSGVPLINVADVYQEDFEIDATTLERVQATEKEQETYRVDSGDLFFVRSSLKLEGTGRSAVALDCDLNTVFECHLVQARPDKKAANPHFLAIQLNSYGLSNYLVSRANTVTMATVAQGVLSTLPVFLPPLHEQEFILSRVEGALMRVGRAVQCALREIQSANEYHTRLIADVVTGKLDVRDAAALLPEVDPLNSEDGLEELDAGDDVDHDELDTVPEEADA